jgi:large subunit ribosomal protein L17
MKHLKRGRKLGRKKKPRKALLKILVGELLARGKIVTTEAKAKELKIFAEKILGKMKDAFSGGKKKSPDFLSAVRRLKISLPKNIGPKMLFEIAQSLPMRKSGFVRIIKTGSRRSDGARMAQIEIIRKEEPKKQ